jgi:hypothetical protein
VLTVVGDAPPQTIIWPLVQTAVWPSLTVGAPLSEVAVQLSLAGEYRPPVFSLALLASMPPHTTIWLPVQTAV